LPYRFLCRESLANKGKKAEGANALCRYHRWWFS